MTDSFGFESNIEQELDLEENPTARVEELKRRVQAENTTDPEEIMLLIMEIFTIEVLYPERGNFYTFVYTPKTPNIDYDQHPLITCVDIFKWGFRGVNFHWNDYRNYTWQEVAGFLHVVKDDEIEYMKSIPYGHFLRTAK